MSDVTIFTGGSGVLGSEFKKIRPDFLYPTSTEFNVCDYELMESYVQKSGLTQLIHAAAFISSPNVDKDPLKALKVNIVGTANVVQLCMKYNAKLVYISTDYVFPGTKGFYNETESVFPVNKYGWSKLGGECAVRLYDKSLIIRTTFSSETYPHKKAFYDQWTSKELVSVIAKKLEKAISHQILGVMHIGGPRKSLFEYARSLPNTQDIEGCSVKTCSTQFPVDTSLDCSRYNQIFNQE